MHMCARSAASDANAAVLARAGTCRKVALDCGTAAGRACCPSLYRASTNPPLAGTVVDATGDLCDARRNLMCVRTSSSAPGAAGTCAANKPDCGRIGSSCCVTSGSVSTRLRCGAEGDEQGPRGYCAFPGGRDTGDMRDMVCTPCPAPSVVAADTGNTYGFNCLRS
jgi:hypothetical protein